MPGTATGRKKNGRPFRPSTVPTSGPQAHVHVRLSPEVDAALRRLAEADSRSLAAVVEAAVTAYAQLREEPAA